MATWRSIAKMVFNLERYRKGDFGYGHYEDVTFTWEYGTVADSLCIVTTDSEGEKREYFGNYDAEAQLKVLANWYATYEGKDRLKDLLKEELSGED